ncbi:hypothetical protein [Streptomyces violaceusniger]|uniref:Uncharacterized protein n=1 Tax=Streptomyces violaceusniger (strain Tu 4113) TaxID=653045 RepID=G2PHU3_STRV4|nr:hypothetical protein [Streptomyces violaceusniger]AEM88894.1 hypothetical protein Strvi_0118 [Streptomyces violaceusniger Tu 4113]
MTPAQPPKSPLEASQDAKRTRGLHTETAALTDKTRKLTSARWYPSWPGDRPTAHVQCPGPEEDWAHMEALCAHRASLHAMQVITGSVTRALDGREPLTALVALNLLHVPVTSNAQAARDAETLGALFVEPT